MAKNAKKMTEREQLLTKIINIILMEFRRCEWDDKPCRISFSKFSGEQNIEIGDVVVGETGTLIHPSIFSIAVVEKVVDKHHLVVRDLMSDKQCDYSNESFTVIKKEVFGKYILLYGEKKKMVDYAIDQVKNFWDKDLPMLTWGEWNIDDEKFSIEIGRKYHHNESYEKVEILANEGYEKFVEKIDAAILETARKLAKNAE